MRLQGENKIIPKMANTVFHLKNKIKINLEEPEVDWE
jgi:hypothetical protein